ncbi:cytochrome P450 [Aeromicrobium sp. REDSEA-S32_B7]|uniref:cytochrome P450 n=2 Tax=unclassified Aeromicrobium TaxID=2633570 RepID=UPI000AAD0C5A|nr:cytochrome P450 [Aeromicrobium sp. REDSEA-S32_B7]
MKIIDEAASLTRWGLNHALPRVGIQAGARRGDLQARLIMATSTGSDSQAGGGLPLDLFEEVRASGALHKSAFAYVTATHPVVKEVLGSPDVHAGVDFGTGGLLGPVRRWADSSTPIGPLTPPSLLSVEPPEHTRYRKLVTRVFSVKAVRGLQDRTQDIADQLLDDLASSDDETVDLVERYCALLPVTVIAEILGVPHDQRDKVLEFGEGAAPSLDLGLPLGRFRAVERSLRAFERWLDDHIAAVRRDPGDDLLSQLVLAQDDDGVELTDLELKATAGLVLAAGFETTVNLLGNGIALLHEHPEQLELLQEKPDLWSRAVDEGLRSDPPVLLTGRSIVNDTVLGGREVPRGSVVTTLLAGANRDPDVFADPQRFDVSRENADQHVSFSSQLVWTVEGPRDRRDPRGHSMSHVSPKAAFGQWIEDVQASAQLHPGVEHLESTLEHLRRSAVTESVDRQFAVSRLGDLAQEWPLGAVEILEYVLRDARWPELETLLREVRSGAEDFRHRDLARQVLEVYDEDWPAGEIYRRYR